MQIQIYLCNDNHNTDITLQSEIIHSLFSSLNIHHTKYVPGRSHKTYFPTVRTFNTTKLVTSVLKI